MRKSRYKPRQKIKLQNQIPKDIKPTKITFKFAKLQRKIIVRIRLCCL